MAIAVVAGMIGTYPVGGAAWDYAQYALGLERLGFDVYYLEDTGVPAYDPNKRTYSENCSYAVNFLSDSLRSMSSKLGGRWHFRNVDGRSFGIGLDKLKDILVNCEIFLNISGGTLLRDEYFVAKCKVLIDTDPGWNHFVNFPKWDANPGWQGSHGFRAHDFFFTYALNIGRSSCLLPTLSIEWNPTLPPVVLSAWNARPPGETWTTILTWNNFNKPISFNGVSYGTKEREFEKIEHLPSRVKTNLEVAVGGADPPTSKWKECGWLVTSSEVISRTVEDYRQYIESSRGEFSVAKNVYVQPRTGWFSCRSVCYLAAGRPVVVQDTGFSDHITTGEGLLCFSSLEEAIEAIESVEANYSSHQEAARQVAARYFCSDIVLSDILEKVGVK